MYEDKYLKSIDKGEIYDGDQIKGFVLQSKGRAKVICNQSNFFNLNSDMKFKVIDIKETFVHYSNQFGDYITPNDTEKLYFIERV